MSPSAGALHPALAYTRREALGEVLASSRPETTLPPPHGHFPVVDPMRDRSSRRAQRRAPISEPHWCSQAGEIRTGFAGLAGRTVEQGEVLGAEAGRVLRRAPGGRHHRIRTRRSREVPASSLFEQHRGLREAGHAALERNAVLGIVDDVNRTLSSRVIGLRQRRIGDSASGTGLRCRLEDHPPVCARVAAGGNGLTRLGRRGRAAICERCGKPFV